MSNEEALKLQQVTFFGPISEPRAKLPIPIPYSDRVFGALHTKVLGVKDLRVPKILADWAGMEGWWDAPGPTLLSREDVTFLIQALSELSLSDFEPDGPKPEDLLGGANKLRDFLEERLSRGEDVFLENK